MKNKNFKSDKNITIYNEQTDKKTVFVFSDTQNIYKNYVENVELLGAFETAINTPIQTKWNEHGGCLVNLSDDQIITIIKSLMNLFHAMISSECDSSKNMAKTVNLKLIGDLKSILKRSSVFDIHTNKPNTLKR